MSQDAAITSLHDAIVDRVRAVFPSDAVPSVLGFPGEVGAAEIKRYALRSPAVIIAPLGLDPVSPKGGSILMQATFCAYIITRRGPDESRGHAGLQIATRLMRILPSESFCIPVGGVKFGQAKSIRSSNFFSGDIDKMGVMLWGVMWDHDVYVDGLTLSCDSPPQDPTLGEFLLLANDWDVSPIGGDTFPQDIEPRG